MKKLKHIIVRKLLIILMLIKKEKPLFKTEPWAIHGYI